MRKMADPVLLEDPIVNCFYQGFTNSRIKKLNLEVEL